MTTSRTTRESSTTNAENDWIVEHTANVIDAYLLTRDKVDFARSVKSMTDHTIHEYGGRFLLELLQNGYDAHAPARSDGRIAVVVRHEEGEHGTVYVANTGAGFTRSNVHAISNLGLSDKPVGEGIGNKGVGFKSVLQVTNTPEVYSREAPDEPGSRGYRFRFATADDIRQFATDPATAQDVLDNVSLLNLIVPMRGVPEQVSQLWEDGYVTVIRLPLRNEAAHNEARLRLNELRESQAPVMLFLRRLASVSLLEVGPGSSPPVELTRHGRDLPGAPTGVTAQLVELNGTTEHFVFTRDIPTDRLRVALERAVAQERLDRRWLEWRSPASVSVAAPIGTTASGGRCYTYLPLGEKAPSPFAGHLNAPFFTNLARLDLDESNPLNGMLLDAAGELCLDAATVLADIGGLDAKRAIVDLLSWSPGLLPHLVTASEQGDHLLDRRLIPTADGGWTTMGAARRWPAFGADILTAQLAHDACGLDLLSDELGSDRESRLLETSNALDVHLDPTPVELADAVETMMSHCLKRGLTFTQWELAYDDVAVIFAQTPEVLGGRRLLLAEDMTLRACAVRGSESDRTSPIPFFPPVRQRVEDEEELDATVDVTLPRALTGRRVFYLHPDLRWYDDNRQQNRARRFLQDSRLVRRFDTRTILEHLASVLATSRSRTVHAEALRFTYNAATADRATHVALNELGLRVPNIDGALVPAAEALFTEDWKDTAGADLTTLAATPSETSTELAGLRRRLIAAPDRLLRASDDRGSWLDFLRKLGVSDQLPVNNVPEPTLRHGGQLTRRYLDDVAGLPEQVRAQWKPLLRERSAAQYPETPYRARSAIHWLPGQAEYALLPTRARLAYARLVLAGLTSWPEEFFTTTWERDRPGDKDPARIPTPLQAFIATADWLRVHAPGGGESFRTPELCWYYPIRGNDLPPRFSPLISKDLRDLIDDDARALNRLSSVGLRQWTAPADAADLVFHLGDLLAAGDVADVHLAQFDRSNRQAWATLATRDERQIPVDRGQRRHLVIDVGGKLQPLDIGEVQDWPVEQRLLVTDSTDDTTIVRVLSEFGQPLLRVDRDADAVTDLIGRWFGNRVGRVQASELTVVADGHPFHPTSEVPRLLADVPWLRLVVATVVAHPRGAFAHLGERAFQDTVDSLDRVRLLRCDRLSIEASDQTRELPRQLNGVLPIADEEYPTLAVRGHAVLTWTILEAIAEPLMTLINRQQLAAELALVLLKLQTAGVDIADGPTHQDVAAACSVNEPDVLRTSRRLDAAFAPLLERLQPIVAHFCGVDAARRFDPDADDIRSDEELLTALTKLSASLPEPAPTLLDRARNTANHDELRRALGIPLKDHNTTLLALGTRYRPVDYSAQHAEEFALHVSARWQELSTRIRWSRLPGFLACDVGADWASLRRRSCLTHDSTWGTSLDSLDEPTMARRVDVELRRLLGEEPPLTGPALDPLDDVRRANAELLDKSTESLTVAVRAWLLRNDQTIRAPWNEPADAAAQLRTRLDEAGALDFVLLDVASVIGWLKALDVWPADMPASVTLADLDLTEADIDAQRSEAERERLARQRARRIVEVDGQPFDTADGLSSLRDAVRNSLSAGSQFLSGGGRFAKLAEVPTSTGSGRSGGGGGGGPHREQLSDAQQRAVGFAGEWLAYAWLRAAYGELVTEECWKSSYRAVEFPGDPGDDALGYDFLVPARGGDLMFEVKATRGPAGEIQLGESEVRTAQANSRNRRWRLLVIENALTTQRRRLLLPNPFSPASRGRYTFAGQGLRLRFITA
ncbi:MAG TPA: DUF3883 domain-containing protein [Mycobacteriales bacterium]|nr:DUF3883 domain-containing protein [Mycobacteriales bacterium]